MIQAVNSLAFDRHEVDWIIQSANDTMVTAQLCQQSCLEIKLEIGLTFGEGNIWYDSTSNR
jgi:hypothetical protein